MRETRVEGKTVQAAIDKGLLDLGLRRDQVEVDVIEKGSSGFLGFGAKIAVVVVREKKWRSDRNGGNDRGGERRNERNDRGGNRRDGGPRRDRNGGRNDRNDRGGNRRDGGRRPQGGGRRGGPGGNKMKRDDGFYSVNAETFEKIPLSALTKPQQEPRQDAPVSPQQEDYQPAEPMQETNAPLIELELKPIPQELEQSAQSAKTALGEIMTLMGLKADNITMGWDPAQSRIMLDFDCDQPETVIGKEGHTIEAIQYLIILMISRKGNTPVAVQIDTNKYWRRLESRIIAGIHRGVQEVESTGRVFRLEPMSPAMRRFVHKMLADNPKVETYSEGEGKWRKVVLRPKQAQKA
jgi:spoIIIJ-associated protein